MIKYIRSAINKLKKQIIQNTSVAYKNMQITMILIIIPFIAISVFYYINIKSTVSNEFLTMYNQVANQYTQAIDYKLNIYNNLLKNISISDKVQNYLISNIEDDFKKFETEKELLQTIEGICNGNEYNDVHNLFIVKIKSDKDGSLTYYEEQFSLKTDSPLPDLSDSSIKKRAMYYLMSDTDDSLIYLIKPVSSIDNSNRIDIIGAIIVSIDINEFFNINEFINNSTIFILNENDKEIYASDEDLPKEYIANSLEKDTVNYNLSDLNLIILKQLDHLHLKALFGFSMKNIRDQFIKSIFSFLSLITILTVVCVTLIYIFSKSLFKRLQLLFDKMDSVKKGDFNTSYTIEGNDEIGVAARRFDDMVLQLRIIIKDNYLNKIAKKEAELLALQTQINPHFLFNTIECINSMSLVYKCPEIGNVARKLGEMFRYNIHPGTDDYALLEEEINQVRNYVEIQKIRFGNKFDVSINIPDELLEKKVLKFLLQPLVENIIKHGFANKREYGYAEIYAKKIINGNIIIKVHDDGIGIPLNLLKDIKMALSSDSVQIKQKTNQSIGLTNVNARIKLAYGDEYGLQVDSVYRSGVTVTVILADIT